MREHVTGTAFSQNCTRVVLRIITGIVLVYLVAPIFVIVPLSFTSGQLLVFPLPGWSLQWYREFFTNPSWTSALGNSVLIGIATMCLATVLGTAAALGLHGSRSRFKAIIFGFLVTPLAVPVVIVAVALYYYFAAVGLVGTYLGLVLAHTVLALPFVIVTVSATLQSFDPNLVRAALSLGSSPTRAFRTVTLPIIAPGVIAGALFAFVTSFDEVVVALFLASPQQRTLPRQIFSGVSENITPAITAAAVILLVVSIVLMAVVELLRQRGERLRLRTFESP
jgi:putative spermidine/putrescine transport system permease protein